MLDHVVRSTEVYLVPKNNGQIVVGASAEERGFDNRNTAGEIFELLRAAWECVPAIRELPLLEIGVGFRPATTDHLPLLGRTKIDGLAVAAGYYRHGILFAPYAAHRWPNIWFSKPAANGFIHFPLSDSMNLIVNGEPAVLQSSTLAELLEPRNSTNPARDCHCH